MRRAVVLIGVVAVLSLMAVPASALTSPVLSVGTVTETTVALSWTDGGNETSYVVRQSTDGVTFVTVQTLGANVHQTTVTGLTPDTDYWFRVNAKKGGTSALSNIVGPVHTFTPPAGPFRAFSDASEWNKPLPLDAPIHPNSDAIIAEIKTYNNGDAPRIAAGIWAEPNYFSDASDPIHTIVPTSFGPTLFNVHISAGARPTETSDAQMTVFDQAKGVVFKLHHTVFNGTTYTAESTSEYALASNGLHCQLVESDATCPMNTGHRGYPPGIHSVRYDEVAAGAIQHVIKVALNRTAECHVYPGQGHENGRGGVLTCQGLILRIKPSVNLAARGLSRGALIIARAMQRYGVVIGDTGGNAMEIKVENLAIEGRPETWSTFGITNTSFVGKLNFNDFQVIAAGYHRP